MSEPRSSSGRGSTDWEAAFRLYASLPVGERSYAAVAEEFGVSVRTVETHGRAAGWRARLREIEQTAAREVDRELVESRSQELRKIGKLIEASFVEYANRLRRGEVRMSPADLERLYRLQHQVIGELAEPRAETETSAPPARTTEHISAVLDALAETGSLEALGLTRREVNKYDTSEEGQIEHDRA